MSDLKTKPVGNIFNILVRGYKGESGCFTEFKDCILKFPEAVNARLWSTAVSHILAFTGNVEWLAFLIVGFEYFSDGIHFINEIDPNDFFGVL